MMSGDLIVVMLQRIAAILHFFNPVVWFANRVIHQLREYACDDLALALGHASGVESGEAFVRILRHASGRRRGLNGALGVFGLDSRAACLRRVSRLLDTGRPIRPAPGVWSFWGFLVLAVISLPCLRRTVTTHRPKLRIPPRNRPRRPSRKRGPPATKLAPRMVKDSRCAFLDQTGNRFQRLSSSFTPTRARKSSKSAKASS